MGSSMDKTAAMEEETLGPKDAGDESARGETTENMDLENDNPPPLAKSSSTNDDDMAGDGDGDDLLTSSTDDDDSNNGDEDKNDAPSESGEEALLKAVTFKEEGNAHFQKGEFDQAARVYRKGINRLKKVSGTDADPQVTSLKLTLQTNLSMCLFKQAKYRASRDVASKALELDKHHVKALYRRALASKKMGDLDQAKADLRVALSVDSNNVACKKELAAVKKQIEQSHQQQKAALAKAFSSKTSLYKDKEEEEKQKQLEKERKQKEKELQKQQRKQQWEDECVKRMANGGEAISFEEWEKEQDEIAKAEKKKQEAKRKKEEKERREAMQAAKKLEKENSMDDDDDDDDDDTLTAAELASLRGYKKTKDGRTTSYFTRELSEEERQKIGSIAPQKLVGNTASTSTTPDTSPQNLDTSTASRPSAWNQAGTWEEKDCTTWCKESLTNRLQSTVSTTTGSSSLSAPFVITISKVDELTGEGSVATTGGKKRYIFDFHVKLSYKISRVSEEEKKETVAKGVVRLPDIASGHVNDEDLEIAFDSSWSKAPPTDDAQTCLDARNQLAKELLSSVQLWVEDFTTEF